MDAQFHVSTPPDPSKPRKNFLSIPNHPSIDTWTHYYAERNPRSFQTLLGRAEAYVMPAQRVFARHGLPEELVYVALVESGFLPMARSHANAVGMWQFIASTGERFGLEQNKWRDERRHPLKAAQAAAEYLSHLYDLFDCWALALAAYNSGEGRVQATLDRTGLKTFWELRDNGFLPAETRDYVPKIMAAIKISRNPERYGFHYEPWRYTPRYETVVVPGGVKLCWLGGKIGVDEQTLKSHNPELQSTLIPPHVPAYELTVPVGKREAVVAAVGGQVSLGELAIIRGEGSGLGTIAAAPQSELVQQRRGVRPFSSNSGHVWVGSAENYVSDNSNMAFQVRKISSSRATFEESSGATHERAGTSRFSIRRGDAGRLGKDRVRVSTSDVHVEHELSAVAN